MIRVATHRDLTPLVRFGRRAHEGSAYAFLPFSPSRLRRALTGALRDPDCQVWVAEDEGEICGALIGVVDQMIQCNARYATDMDFAADKHGDELLDAFTAWAAARGAKVILMGDSQGDRVPAKDRLYRRKGLVRMGSMYMKRL